MDDSGEEERANRLHWREVDAARKEAAIRRWRASDDARQADAEAHGREYYVGSNSHEEYVTREAARRETIIARIYRSYDKEVKRIDEILATPPGGRIQDLDPKIKRLLFIAYKYFLAWPAVDRPALVGFEFEWDATDSTLLNETLGELVPYVNEKKRELTRLKAEEDARKAAQAQVVARMMAEAEERRKVATAAVAAAVEEERKRIAAAQAFNSKVAGEAAARENAGLAREAAVKEQAAAALVGDRWKLAIIKDMDPEEKRHFAVALLHKQTPGVPVYPLYAEVDKIEPGAIDEYIEQLRNELSPRVAPREDPANVGNPFNRITNSMLGGTRRRKQKRSKKRRATLKH
jgi:hypothetical protein